MYMDDLRLSASDVAWCQLNGIDPEVLLGEVKASYAGIRSQVDRQLGRKPVTKPSDSASAREDGTW